MGWVTSVTLYDITVAVEGEQRERLVSRNYSGRRSSLNVLLHFSLSPLRKIKDTHTHIDRQTDRHEG